VTAPALALTTLALAAADCDLLSLDETDTLAISDWDAVSLATDTLADIVAAERVEEMDGDGGGEFDRDELGDEEAAERVDVMDGDDSVDEVEDTLGEDESAVCVAKEEELGCAEAESRNNDGVSGGVNVAELDCDEEIDAEFDADTD
jgi:hypothetical protein